MITQKVIYGILSLIVLIALVGIPLFMYWSSKQKPKDIKPWNGFYVLGRSSNQIHQWARRNEIPPTQFRMIFEPIQLKGARNMNIVILPGYNTDVIDSIYDEDVNKIFYGDIRKPERNTERSERSRKK